VLFLTDRSPRHQQAALAVAPPACQVVMLRNPDRATLLEQIADAEFLVSERAGEIDAGLIAAAPKLRLIQRLGSMTHDIDLDAARQAGVAVSAWPVQGCVMVAEHMLLQMLALARRLPESVAIAHAADAWGQVSRRTDENVFAYNWSRRSNLRGLWGASVGILGFGEIGAELARRLVGCGPSAVRYHKRRRLPASVETALGITYALPDEIVGTSEFLCVLLPYMAETDLSLNATTFAAMPTGSFVVHCGSGSVLDEAALAAAIASGQLGGAALDTFEWEPLRQDNPLQRLALDPASNVLLTPHTGAAGGREDGRESDWANIRALLAGEPLRYRVV
jgi:phosphoglycerate dehydrogenase-like enzyme